MLSHLFLHRLIGFQIKSWVRFCSLILGTFSPNVTLLLLLLLFLFFFFLLLFFFFFFLLFLLLLLPGLRSFELFRIQFNFLCSVISYNFLVTCVNHSISRYVTYHVDDYCPRSLPSTMIWSVRLLFVNADTKKTQFCLFHYMVQNLVSDYIDIKQTECNR